MAYGTINAEQLTTQSGFTLGAGNASSFKNRILNGSMVLDQRNAGASVTPASRAYTLDRWVADMSAASKYSVQQNAGAVTPPTGFTNYLGVTSTAATALGATDFYAIVQIIEGFNISDLAWGTANAQAITVSFWVRSSLTGTFGGAINNSGSSRSYPFTYTISAANTWEQKSVTIAGDTSGTWLTTNGIGLYLVLGLGCGTTRSGTAGAWNSNWNFSATGATSVVGTNGATLYITGVQLEVGTVATSFDYRSYGTELGLCQRYFYKTYNTEVAVGASTSVGSVYCETLADGTLSRIKAFNPRLPVSMRATPTVTLYSQTGTADRINVYSNSASTLTVSSVQNSGTNSLLSYIQTSTNGVAAQTYEFQAIASAEL